MWRNARQIALARAQSVRPARDLLGNSRLPLRSAAWLVISLAAVPVLTGRASGSEEFQTEVALRVCAAIENGIDRLACYDRISGKTPRVTRLASGKGVWSVSEETSKLTDEKTVTMTVTSQEEVSCGRLRNEPTRLYVRCLENRTSVFFSTNCHMTSSEYNTYGDITYRLDDAPAAVVSAVESTDSRALGLWRGGTSIPFIKRMFGAETLTVRMTPYGESPFIVTFDIRGLEDQIQPLRDACHW